MEINPLIAFGAGLVSVFSPCVLIVLPAVMASSTGRGKWRPLAIVLGLSISFTAMGFLASAFGSAFQSVKGYLDVFAIMIVVVIGVWMLFDLHLPYNAPRLGLSLIHISEPTRLGMISYAVFCLKKKKKKKQLNIHHSSRKTKTTNKTLHMRAT